LDHHNLPVAGDCLLALPITPAIGGYARRLKIPPLLDAVGTMFSIIVKFKSFTKHISSQWTPQNLLHEGSCCCTATVSGAISREDQRRLEKRICLVN
jgi:hypothetical protein